MQRSVRLLIGLSAFAIVSTFLPVLGASAASTSAAQTIRVSATLPASLSPQLPLVRLYFSAPVKARSLPALVTKPALATTWQQTGPNSVQAVATSAIAPATSYTINTPTQLTCSTKCAFASTRPHLTAALTSLTWEAQLLAELLYLPVTFSPNTLQTDPTVQTPGTFTWAYPSLPTSLSAQWQVGTDNVILHAAMMTFQSQHNLTVTGEIDPTTWNTLLNAAKTNSVDPAPYNYVDVSESLPETETLYIGGIAKFHTLVNTGAPGAPTELGTFAVYSRFISTTMSGTNPDGSHYSDPGIPWVSYFNGGDALHGFIRATYGWPQSDGCVEQPFAAAKTVFPHTPIGTLVTVHA